MRQSLTSRHRRWRLWSRIASEGAAAVLLAAASVASAASGVSAASIAAAAEVPARAQPQPGESSSAPERTVTPVQQPIVINAGFSRVDYTTNTVVFRNIVVSQGDTRLTAERARATGVGFANSEWTFEDGVVIDLLLRGTLRCDRAIVTFRDNHITGATATGQPARFEQRSSGSRGATAHGQADRIVYDAESDSVRLSGDPRFADARGLEVSGPELLYDIRTERLQAVSAGEGRGVHITLTPGHLPRRGKSAAGRAPRR